MRPRHRMLIGVAIAACAAASGCGRSSLSTVSYDPAKVKEIREALAAGGSESDAGPAVQLGTGWATLRGRVVLDGAAPARPRLNITKDVEVCTANPDATLSQAFRVSDDGAVRDFLVFARDVNRVHESAATPPADPIVFDQEYCEFLSHVIGVRVGQPVLLKNSDTVGHNTKIEGLKSSNTFNQTIPAKAEISWTPGAEESLPFSVSCSIHPWMSAKMLPRENGYYAVSAPDGTFEIANLPAGEDVELQLWHEAVGSMGAVTVEGLPGGAKPRSNGRVKVQFPENSESEVTITIPASAVSVPGA